MMLRKTEEQSINYNSKILDIEVVNNVIEGLRKVKEAKPSLLVIDILTARICGIDLLKIIRSNPANHHIKIIFTSKNYNYKFLREVFFLGADFYTKYPPSIEELEKIYINLKSLDNYYNLENIAKYNDYEWIEEM